MKSRGKNTKTMYCWDCGCALDDAEHGGCPNCGRSFVPWDSTTYRVEALAHLPRGARCSGCDYLLDGLRGCICPECGRSFNIHDPSTYHLRPGMLVRRRIISLIAIVLGLGCVWIGWLYLLWGVWRYTTGSGAKAYGLMTWRHVSGAGHSHLHPWSMALTAAASCAVAIFLIVYGRWLYSRWTKRG